jgi:hypothetical protein
LSDNYLALPLKVEVSSTRRNTPQAVISQDKVAQNLLGIANIL